MLKGIAWKFRATFSRGLDRLSTRIVVPPRTPATLTVCKNKHGSAEFAFPSAPRDVLAALSCRRTRPLRIAGDSAAWAASGRLQVLPSRSS